MALAWVISILAVLVIAFLTGYHFRELRERIKSLQEIINQKKDKPLPDKEKSSLVDPLDPIRQAEYDMKKKFESMNPDYYE